LSGGVGVSGVVCGGDARHDFTYGKIFASLSEGEWVFG